MNRWVVCLIAAPVFSGASVSRLAVADVVAKWPFTGNTYAPTIAGTPIAGLVVSNLTATSLASLPAKFNSSSPPFSNYTGASGATFLDLGWSRGAFSVTARNWISFTVTNNSATPIQLTEFAFGIRNAGTGPPSYTLRYDNVGGTAFTSEIAGGSTPSTNAWGYRSHIDLTLMLPVGSVTEFRLYGYGGTPGTEAYNTRFDDIRAVFTAVASVPETSAWAMGTAAVVAAWGAARFGRTNR